ncbi:hypothetical protein ACFXTI_029525 [Malus domestica]
MNEFAQQAESMGEGMARTVMSRFKPKIFPVYTGLANEILDVDLVECAARIHDLNETRSNLLALQQKLRLILYVYQALSALKLWQ